MEKKYPVTNWSVNQYKYFRTVLFSEILCYSILSLYYDKIVVTAMLWNYLGSIALIYATESGSKELKFDMIKAIIIPIMVTFLISVFGWDIFKVF
jgi:hypothetical protein